MKGGSIEKEFKLSSFSLSPILKIIIVGIKNSGLGLRLLNAGV